MPMVHNLSPLPSGVVLDGTEDYWLDKFHDGEWHTYRVTIAEIFAGTGGVALDTVNVFTANQSVAPITLVIASAGAVETDASAGNNFEVTLTENVTFQPPTNPTGGMVCNWAIAQDGTGGWTGTFDAAFDFGAAGAPTLSTGPNVVDFISGYYHAGTSKWLCSFRQGA